MIEREWKAFLLQPFGNSTLVYAWLEPDRAYAYLSEPTETLAPATIAVTTSIESARAVLPSNARKIASQHAKTVLKHGAELWLC